MIYSVTGKLVHIAPELAVINCGGVGYACRTTLATIADIQGKTGDVTLLTHLAVREDAVELFGFSTSDELNWFELLLGISGVGPKAAISILSGLSTRNLALAIASGDAKAFTQIKGIGLKTAQRIVLELKDKVAKGMTFDDGADVDFSGVSSGAGNPSQAVAALTSLGYSQSEAATAVAKLDRNLSVEELIKLALKNLAGY